MITLVVGTVRYTVFLAAVELRKHLFLYILSELTAPGLPAVHALAWLVSV